MPCTPAECAAIELEMEAIQLEIEAVDLEIAASQSEREDLVYELNEAEYDWANCECGASRSAQVQKPGRRPKHKRSPKQMRNRAASRRRVAAVKRQRVERMRKS